MFKFNRFVTASAAALMLAATIGMSAPAHADTTTPAPVPTVDPASYVPLEVAVTADTPIYWGTDVNDMITSTDSEMLHAGETWYILGQDVTGKWVEVYLTPTQNVWVPKSSFALKGVPLPILY